MVKILFNSWFCNFMDAGGLMMYPFVLIATSEETTHKCVMRHELIHIEQVEREGILSFYFKYYSNVIKDYLRHGDLKRCFLHENPFEMDAYSRQYTEFTKRDLEIMRENGVEWSKRDQRFYCRQ